VAVGLGAPGALEPVAGVRLSSIACGIKANSRPDLLLMELIEGSVVAGVFTQNLYCAPPVEVAREHLSKGGIRAFLVNAGNANAGTGAAGKADARMLCECVAEHLSITAEQVLPFSTGVIGQRLPVELIADGIAQLSKQIHQDNWLPAAESIMTTDTVPKAISSRVMIDGKQVTITGISKGSGMIHPNMATMLSYIATDALVDQVELQSAVTLIADKTFNCITVDGDTSTNDAFMVAATGCAGNQCLAPGHPQWREFYEVLENLALHLAQAIVRDGEGATRFISIEVSGGATPEDCRQVALTIAHSPLVKTAFFAGDPNLGRILAAVGRSGVSLDMDKVSLRLGDLAVVSRGMPSPGYDEQLASDIMAREDVPVVVDLGSGKSSATIWTTDLSYDYVKINAEYRT